MFESDDRELVTTEQIARWLADLRCWDREVRLEAVRRLGERRIGRAVPALIRALQDSAPEVRTAAISALGRMQAERALPALERLLLDGDPDSPLIAEMLRSFGRPAVPALCRILLRGNDEGRRLAAEALVQIADPHSARALADASRDSHVQVALLAIKGLGILRDPETVPGLALALRSRYAGIRLEAVEALRLIGDQAAADALWKTLNHPDSSTRHAAGVALVQLEDVTPEVRSALAGLYEAQWQPMAAREAVPHLLKVLRYGSDRRRERAAEWLGFIADREPSPNLAEALPLLESRLGLFAWEAPAARTAYAEALLKIEAALERFADLPLPSAPEAQQNDSLPVPSAPSAPEAEGLPLPSRRPERTQSYGRPA